MRLGSPSRWTTSTAVLCVCGQTCCRMRPLSPAPATWTSAWRLRCPTYSWAKHCRRLGQTRRSAATPTLELGTLSTTIQSVRRANIWPSVEPAAALPPWQRLVTGFPVTRPPASSFELAIGPDSWIRTRDLAAARQALKGVRASSTRSDSTGASAATNVTASSLPLPGKPCAAPESSLAMSTRSAGERRVAGNAPQSAGRGRIASCRGMTCTAGALIAAVTRCPGASPRCSCVMPVT